MESQPLPIRATISDEEINDEKKPLKQLLQDSMTKYFQNITTSTQHIQTKSDNITNKFLEAATSTQNELSSQNSELPLSNIQQRQMVELSENYIHRLKQTYLLQQAFASTFISLRNIQHALYKEKESLLTTKNPVYLFYNNNQQKFEQANISQKMIQKVLLSEEEKLTIVLKKGEDNSEVLNIIENKPDAVHITIIENIDENEYIKIFGKGIEDNNNKLLFKNVSLTLIKCDIPSISLGANFECTKKIYIKKSPTLFGDIKLFNDLSNLTTLSLTKCNINTYTFDLIMKNLIRFQNTLEYLSFANNKITRVFFPMDETGNAGIQFTKLKELDFENNKIYRFDSSVFGSPDKESQFRVIYLSSNSFAFGDNYHNLIDSCKAREKYMAEKYKNKTKQDFRILIMISKNLFMTKGEHRKEYFEYLNSVLPQFNYPLKYLTLEMLFNLYNKQLLCNLNFSNQIKANLIHLNLSSCSLNDKDIITFISRNQLIALKKLNVSFNNISNSFFKEYYEQKINEYLPLIEKIDFSGNDNLDIKTQDNNYSYFISFIESNINLKKIIFFRTLFDNTVQTFIKYKSKIIKQIGDKDSLESIMKNYKMSEKENNINSEIDTIVKLIDNNQHNKNIICVFRLFSSKTTIQKIKELFENALKYFEFKTKQIDN